MKADTVTIPKMMFSGSKLVPPILRCDVLDLVAQTVVDYVGVCQKGLACP